MNKNKIIFEWHSLLKDIIKNKVENRIIIVNKIKEKSNREEK